MLAENHIFNLNTALPLTLMDKLLTAVEHVLTEEGATHIWVDGARSDTLAVHARIGSSEPVEAPLSARV
ncbi:hypothetical protein ASC77_21680 [Nocardioides sp. Root1257]|uniref:hypothetical protein n=1 Tax=unclassified Nocardioides TaxID=2615069 RepID=UPI0006FA3A57|nr:MULTISPECIES: hypothetical protein [unclassified Nocardioides]KQW44005.1 hypothetical protein ASC77_21680 [Nocardioides sp. Root1257]KRC42446.1 hypothetical protein ASE24_21475 [Nocardioides sp. Root224]